MIDKLSELKGFWRGNIDYLGKKSIIDFTIRESEYKSRFTIYIENSENNTINYEWAGNIVELKNHEGLSDIIIEKIEETENEPNFRNLKLFSSDEDSIVLILGDDSKLNLYKTPFLVRK